ncbi:MAG TPA: hypothetical protein VHJ39_19675 [Solirubrobacteraceae bacterium]|jgi:ornithine carbamoyltransferase|nr:hypothetical protein [Solirubrobacteraceae bacterium]
MTTVATPSGVLRIADLTPAELTRLLDLAEAFKADPLRRADALAGQSVACYFSEPSTRDVLTLRERFGGGEEVAAEVIDGPHSAVWQQAANRLPTEQAALYALVSGDCEV